MARIVKKPLERRKEIIASAQKLFLELEYENTTLNHVVNALGIAKGTVYHYFKSKEELLDAVVENMSNEYVEALANNIRKNNAPVLERLQELVTASNVTNGWEETIKKLHQSGNVGLHVRLLALSIKKIAPLYAEIIQQGCEEGIFKTKHPLETAEVLLGGIQFITDLGFYPWRQEDISRRNKAILTIVESQLGVKAGLFGDINRDA